MSSVPSKDFMEGFRFARTEMLRQHDEKEALDVIALKIGKARRLAGQLYMEEEEAWRQFDS